MEEQTKSISPEELKNVILDLWKKGYSKSDIGRILKEEYVVYDVRTIFGKKLSRVLEEDLNIKEEIPEDLRFLLRQANRILRHLEKNKKDMFAKKALEKTESKIKSLIKYYKRKGKLPETFRYSKELARMYGST